MKILDVVGPAFRAGDYVVDVEVARLKVGSASGAVAALLAVQPCAILWAVVSRQLSEVGSPWNVRSVCALVEHSKFVAHALLHELGGLRGDVDPHPLTVLGLSRNAGRRASAERVQNYVASVRTSRDYPLQ